MGKGWAKCLTAATDPRVARVAQAHRGLIYRPRVRTGTQVSWTAELAYVVGLIATDGCLISGRKQIAFVSKDREQCETLLRLLVRTNAIRQSTAQLGTRAYRVQFGDAVLYRWLQSIGLSPRKSLTLGAIDVPDEHLLSLVRGLLDGDGTILNQTYRADTRAPQPYCWEYLQTKFVSASRPHLAWLASSLERVASVTGYLHRNGTTSAGNAMYELRYGKPASVSLLGQLYADRDAPCLLRKREIWSAFEARHMSGARATPRVAG